jgi:hypothetical protein
MGLAAGIVLLIVLFAYTFWPEENPFTQRATSRVDSLEDRRDAIYENLRDLNFEYKAGKYPEEDYVEQRNSLEDEAAKVLAEIDTLRG